MSYRASRTLAHGAVALGAVEFVVRALLRSRGNPMTDLAAPFISTRLLLQGLNPYDSSIALHAWYAAGAPHLAGNDLALAGYSVYPPPTLIFMAPLALLRWQQAHYLFLAFGVLLYAAVIFGLVRLGWPRCRSLSALSREPAALFFVAACLGFAPVHTAFHSVNVVLFASCAAILSILVAVTAIRPAARPRGSGVWIGAAAAICIKPTTGVFLLPWLVRERRWRWFAASILACAAVTALALGPLIARQGLSWLPAYRQNATALFTHGGNADVSQENFENTDRIDLQLLGFAAFGSRNLAAAAAAAIYAGLLLAFMYRAGWGHRGLADASISPIDLPLLVASGSLALGLLPSYSRMYSAIVLLPLVLWCFRHLHLGSARWMLFLLGDFLVNTSALARLIGTRFGLIAPHHRLWDFTIGGHTCWLLLALGGLLVWAVRQQTQQDARPRSAGISASGHEPLHFDPRQTLHVEIHGLRSTPLHMLPGDACR